MEVIANKQAIATRQAREPGCRTPAQKAIAILEAAIMRDKRMNKIVRMRQERRQGK